MNAMKALDLINQYSSCRACGNEALGNGHGSLEITDDEFIRRCKCGWSIEIKFDSKGNEKNRRESCH